jgi:hypothetical protein
MKLWVGVFLVGLLGCSSESNSTNGDGGTTPSGSAATCDTKQAKLSGSLDGTSIEQAYSSNGYALILKDFSGYIGSKGSLQAHFDQAGVSSAGSPIASGTLTMPTEGPLAGQVFCIGGGTITGGDGAYAFTLTNLSKSAAAAGADAGACTGTPVSGEVTGCVRGSK